MRCIFLAMDIQDNVNENTSRMLEALRTQGYYVELEVNPAYAEQLAGAWGMVPVYKIVSQNDTPNPAAFTHELLHVYLYTQGFIDGDRVYNEVFRNNHLLSHGWITTLNNTLAHFKMVRVFEKMGFPKEQFFTATPLDEWAKVQASIAEISPGSTELFGAFVTTHATLRLLKDFFSIETSMGEEELLRIDHRLFEICEECIGSWKAVEGAQNLPYYTMLRDRLLVLTGR